MFPPTMRQLLPDDGLVSLAGFRFLIVKAGLFIPTLFLPEMKT
jgi:hypothetical protein